MKPAVFSLVLVVLCAAPTHAVADSHKECAMMGLMDDDTPEMAKERPEAHHAAVVSIPDSFAAAGPAKVDDLDTLLKAATRKGETCPMHGATNTCPVMGNSMLRYGPCCATRCSPSSPVSESPSMSHSTASPILETGGEEDYPETLINVAGFARQSKYSSHKQGPEPRPPTA